MSRGDLVLGVADSFNQPLLCRQLKGNADAVRMRWIRHHAPQVVSGEGVAGIGKALDAGYGRGFWLNMTDAPHPLPGRWGLPGAPRDAFFARGVQGQYIVVVPSLDLVVVRLGRSFTPGGDMEAVGRLVNRVASALSG